MAIKVKRLRGRPSAFQRLLEFALVGVATDIIKWQKKEKRVATGKSQDWLITLKRIGSNKPKDILANLIGVKYINYALFGRGKGKLPEWQIILKWMRVRGIAARDVQSGRFRSNIVASAKAIARQIGDSGTKATSIGQVMLDLFYKQNLKEAIAKFTPKITEETEKLLANQFVADNVNLKNFQVSTK